MSVSIALSLLIPIGVIMALVVIDLRLKGHKRRPLSAHQPAVGDARPMGMEETDLALVRRVERENKRIQEHHAQTERRHK